MLALSKADLHPELNVHGFHDLVIEKAAGDVAALQDVLKGFVQFPDALSMGEDVILLSSAKFEPGKIEVTERVGVDLILPVALLLPLERLVQWSERFEIPRRLLDKLADNVDAYAEVLLGSTLFRKILSRVPKVGPFVHVVFPALTDAFKGSKSKIKEANEEARRKQDYLTAVLTQFRLDLEQGVRDNLLVTSRK